MKHTDYCTTSCISHQKEVEEFEKNHPNYCRHCDGWGVYFSTYDPSPSGVSLSPGTMLDCDVCPECVDKNLCPLCMIETVPVVGHEDNERVCLTCNWKEDNENHEGLSDGPECHCYLENVVELV